jgi:hypothetical protein
VLNRPLNYIDPSGHAACRPARECAENGEISPTGRETGSAADAVQNAQTVLEIENVILQGAEELAKLRSGIESTLATLGEGRSALYNTQYQPGKVEKIVCRGSDCALIQVVSYGKLDGGGYLTFGYTSGDTSLDTIVEGGAQLIDSRQMQPSNRKKTLCRYGFPYCDRRQTCESVMVSIFFVVTLRSLFLLPKGTKRENKKNEYFLSSIRKCNRVYLDIICDLVFPRLDSRVEKYPATPRFSV